MKRILTILLFLCCAGTNNPDMVVTLLTPTNDATVSNVIQLTATVSFKEKLAAPIIDRIK